MAEKDPSVSQKHTTERRRHNKPLGSVDSFWVEYPKWHAAKRILDGSIELGFLTKGIYVFHMDHDMVCEDTVYVNTRERVRVGLILMIFIHTLHLCRLVFQEMGKHYKIYFKGCLQCILVDCYCCSGTIVYVYVQITWWLDKGQCKEELPEITN